MIPLDTVEERPIPNFHVVVDFGAGIPPDAQGVVMLAMEKALRELGVPAEVFKRTMADDSTVRQRMTDEVRRRL